MDELKPQPMTVLEKSDLLLRKAATAMDAANVKADTAVRYLEIVAGEAETRAAAEKYLCDYFKGIE